MDLEHLKGIPIVNLMTLEKGEKVNVLVVCSKDDESETLLFVTKNGIVKRTSVSEFENINRNGKIAISLKPDDELRFVKLTTGQDEVIISGSNGKSLFDSMKIKFVSWDVVQVVY